MSSLAVVQASNAAYAPTHLPVAIFTGGTSGIARAMAEAFARHTKGRAHIIIIGRNCATAESIIASFPKPTDTKDGWKHEFISCDAALMSNIRSTCADLIDQLPRINYLVLAAGYASFTSTEETSEGLDRQLALRYYSRYVFISSLLPLLTKTRQSGQDARVMSILGGGRAYLPVNLEDLGLKNARAKSQATRDAFLCVGVRTGNGRFGNARSSFITTDRRDGCLRGPRRGQRTPTPLKDGHTPGCRNLSAN